MDPKKLSDVDLFSAFKNYGKQARINTRKSAGFLPELARRGLHRKKRCGSIYELAAKHAMLSRESVDKVLRLDRRFESMPQLRALLENGEVGWSKLEVVATMATPDTDGLWADKVKKMTKSGLAQWVHELKRQRMRERMQELVVERVDDRSKISQNDHSAGGMFNVEELEVVVKSGGESGTDGLQELGAVLGTSASDWRTLSFKLSPTNELKLRQFKQKLEKTHNETMTFNDVVGALLATETNPPELDACDVSERANAAAQTGNVSRHIPAEVKRVIIGRSGGGCEFPNCYRPGTIFHHTRRFALRRNHDPDFIVLLCESHERVAQSNLIEHEEAAPSTWKIRTKAPWWDLKTSIDERVASYRRE